MRFLKATAYALSFLMFGLLIILIPILTFPPKALFAFAIGVPLLLLVWIIYVGLEDDEYHKQSEKKVNQ